MFDPNEKLAKDEERLGGLTDADATAAVAADFWAASAKNSARVAARVAAAILFTSLFRSGSASGITAGLGGGRGGVAEKRGCAFGMAVEG